VSWRRAAYWFVFVVTFVPLFVMLVLGYTADALVRRIEQLEAWSYGPHGRAAR
jgi:hypothetical protein